MKKVVPLNDDTFYRFSTLPRRINTIFPQKNIKTIKPQLIMNSFSTMLLNLLIIVLAVAENNSYAEKNITISISLLYARIVMIAISVLQIFLLVHYWSLRLKFNAAYNKSFIISGFFKGTDCKKLIIFEFFITIIVQPYKFNTVLINDSNVFITLDDLITLISLLRLHFLFRFIYDISYYNSIRAQWIA